VNMLVRFWGWRYQEQGLRDTAIIDELLFRAGLPRNGRPKSRGSQKYITEGRREGCFDYDGTLRGYKARWFVGNAFFGWLRQVKERAGHLFPAGRLCRSAEVPGVGSV
jgi:hypothetical protein